MFVPFEKGLTLSKYSLNMLKVMLSCSTSSKIASFLVRQYSEQDVHLTSILNVQFTSWHSLYLKTIIHHIKRYMSKGRWDSTFKEFFLLISFERSRPVTTKKEHLYYIQQITFMRRRDFTFTWRSSIVLSDRSEHDVHLTFTARLVPSRLYLCKTMF